MDIHTIRQTPCALVIYAPARELLQANAPKVNKTLQSLEQATNHEQLLPFIDDPWTVLTKTVHLSAKEKEVRRTNLIAVSQGFFDLVVMAGSSVSEYVEQVLGCAYQSGVALSLYADEDTTLGRYASWFQRLE